jgi:uncharacterized protein YjbJ (UPF0337 family)
MHERRSERRGRCWCAALARSGGYVSGTAPAPVAAVTDDELHGVAPTLHRRRSNERANMGERNMNWDQISGQWSQIKGSLREKWGKLTDDDLDLVAGNRDKLIGKLQERYGFEKDRALESVDKFIADLKLTPKSNKQ